MKLDANGMRMYSIMSCVYNCNTPEVVVPSDSFKSHKKEAIDEHLSTCECCPDAIRPTKRSRGITVESLANMSSSSTLAPTQTTNRVGCTHCTTLTENNDRLVLQNDQHSNRIHTLETQMDGLQTQLTELRVGMERMRVENQRQNEINRQSHIWQETVSRALGITAPPIPADHVCVDRIYGLQKAASVGSISKPIPNERLHALQREITRLEGEARLTSTRHETSMRALRSEYAKFVTYWKLSDLLLKDKQQSVKDLKEILRFVHPDKFTGSNDTAVGVTLIINFLIQELRRTK